MSQRLFRALLTCVVLFNAADVVAACLPDPPSDDDAVVCDGVDETGYDGSGATGLTITTSGVTILDDTGGLDAALLLTDDNTVTLGSDATLNVTQDGGYGVRGGNDNFFDNFGTITIDGDDARGMALDENTTGVLPNGAINEGTINANGARSIGLETGTNSGVANTGSMILLGDESLGISAGDRTDQDIAANVSNSGTIDVLGTRAIGMTTGDGWIEGPPVPFSGRIGAGVLNFTTGTINVDGNGATGIFAGVAANMGANNSSVLNRGSIFVNGMDAIGVSVGANDLFGRFDVENPVVPLEALNFENEGTMTGSVAAGPLVEFRAFVSGSENRIRNLSGASLIADLTNIGIADRAIAIRGTDGDELVVNLGEIQGIIELNGGDNRYVHGSDAILNGLVSGGDGEDELILLGFGVPSNTFDVSSLIDFDRIELRNDGSWELSNATGFVGSIEILATSTLFAPMPLSLSASGDDLINRGEIQGDVDFGDGDDRYTHFPGATLAGMLIGGAGNDEAILAGANATSGTFDPSVLTQFELLRVNAGAAWELMDAPGFTGLTQVGPNGLLQVPTPITLGGDFAVDSTGTVEITLEAAMPALTVQSATFGGTLVVTPDATLLPSPTPHRAILAVGGASGRFQMQTTAGLDRFTSTYDTSGLLITYQRGLDIVAESANERSIAIHLMAVDAAGGAAPDLQALIDSFDTSTGVLANTLNVLSPEVYDFQTQVVVEGGRRIANLLLDRPRECEMGRKDPWGGIDKRLPCHSRSWAPWLAAIGGFRSREKFDEHRRYDAQMGGLVFGIDSHPTEGLDLTFAIGSQRGTVNAAGAGESTLTLTDVSGHAAWSYGRLRTQAVASWGHGFHQDRRLINQTETDYALDSRGNEDHDSDRITAAVEIGMLFDVASFQIEPLVGVDWAWVYQRPLHESGAGGFGIRIASRDDSIGSINAGLRLSTTYQHSRYLSRQLEWMDGIWKPSLEVRWRQVLHGDDRDIDARFQGSPDTVPDFRISGDEDDGGAEIGAGISFTPSLANRLQFDVRYDAFVAEHTVEHDLVGRVMIGF